MDDDTEVQNAETIVVIEGDDNNDDDTEAEEEGSWREAFEELRTAVTELRAEILSLLSQPSIPQNSPAEETRILAEAQATVTLAEAEAAAVTMAAEAGLALATAQAEAVTQEAEAVTELASADAEATQGSQEVRDEEAPVRGHRNRLWI